MKFDLHLAESFRGITVTPLTSKGSSFSDWHNGGGFETTIPLARELYYEATEQGLHVSFDTAATRDLLALVR